METLFDHKPINRRIRTESATYKQRERAWQQFDRAHPEVYSRFVMLVRAARATGHRRYSARTIIENIRWHYTVNERRDGGFKINDHFSPFYVRKFIAENPEFSGFFELRGEPDDDDTSGSS